MSRKPPPPTSSFGPFSPVPGETPFLLSTAQDESGKGPVRVRAESLWLTLAQLAELFGVGVPAISRHLTNILESGEFAREATVSKMETVQTEGGRQVRRSLEYYNLDAIIAVGYRVPSRRATQFRAWATGVLKEYIKKGFVLDDERLKQGQQAFREDYFCELLERVRSIRASERRIWQQITDIFAECSIDYDPKSELAQDFFATVQNKFPYAITEQTAAEIIHAKADRAAPNMGLTTWKNAPARRSLPSNVTIAKNFPSEPEIKRLERSVSIENLLENRRLFTMAEFVAAVDKFLAFNEYRVLGGRGRLSKGASLFEVGKGKHGVEPRPALAVGPFSRYPLAWGRRRPAPGPGVRGNGATDGPQVAARGNPGPPRPQSKGSHRPQGSRGEPTRNSEEPKFQGLYRRTRESEI